MERAITGWHADAEGDWVAELACGHNQHVRHRPPFQVRDWVLTESGRSERTGAPLECPLCDRGELPGTLRWVRTGPEWDQNTIPPGLLRQHRLAAGTWGVIDVRAGSLRFEALSPPAPPQVLTAGDRRAIPPELLHEVRPVGRLRFAIDFYTVDRQAAASSVLADAGGEGPCLADRVCAECGAVVAGREGHRTGCPNATG